MRASVGQRAVVGPLDAVMVSDGLHSTVAEGRAQCLDQPGKGQRLIDSVGRNGQHAKLREG
jgi:hypothetical protein